VSVDQLLRSAAITEGGHRHVAITTAPRLQADLSGLTTSSALAVSISRGSSMTTGAGRAGYIGFRIPSLGASVRPRAGGKGYRGGRPGLITVADQSRPNQLAKPTEA